MAGSITPSGGGAITCDFVRCAFPSLKTRTRTFERSGFDGYGYVLEAAGDSAFQIRVVKFSTYGLVKTWYESIEACQGLICSVVNDWGTTQGNILIESVRIVSLTTSITHAANQGCRGEVEMMAKRLS